MLITILNVSKVPATTQKGGAYEQLQLAFKNHTFGDKVDGKKLTPFGAGKSVYDTLANAQSGQTYEITVVKENGFNNWTQATPSSVRAAPAQQAAQVASAPATSAYQARSYESAEERERKQVLIVRQSSVSSAVAALSTGSKSPPSAEAVVEYARKLEAYVFEPANAPVNASGFDDMESDVPL